MIKSRLSLIFVFTVIVLFFTAVAFPVKAFIDFRSSLRPVRTGSIIGDNFPTVAVKPVTDKLTITTNSQLRNGRPYEHYYASISGSGGVGNYSWSVENYTWSMRQISQLPPGLSFHQANIPCVPSAPVCRNKAFIQGIPTVLGTYRFPVRLVDGNGGMGAVKFFTIVIGKI